MGGQTGPVAWCGSSIVPWGKFRGVLCRPVRWRKWEGRGASRRGWERRCCWLLAPVANAPIGQRTVASERTSVMESRVSRAVVRFPPKPRLRIVVLISGGGTTLRNLIEKSRAGEVPIDIVLVISSTEKAGGLRFAEEAKIPAVVVPFKQFADERAFSEAIFEHCRRVNPDFVVMGGFLKRLVIPEDFELRVLNIHPALIPAFCGKGYYGRRVHEAVLEFGAKVSGCTVHFADQEYDHGPIILQRAVPVLDTDTPETLAARVFEAECEAYPEALRLLAAGRIEVMGRRVKILPESAA